MKIRDLVRHSGVSKETIHYYIREGLLPRPRKQGRNVAEYDDGFVKRIRFIKDLQDRYFFPLAVIKNILKKQRESTEWQSFLNLSREYFSPVNQFLPTEIAGEDLFRNQTGLGKKWLAKMEEWKIINPSLRDGSKVYSQDDITLGKLIVEMDSIRKPSSITWIGSGRSLSCPRNITLRPPWENFLPRSSRKGLPREERS